MTEINMPQPNIPLLRKAVEWAETEAAKTDGTCAWNQSNWMEQKPDCGTSYCVAGYTVEVAGHTLGAETELCPGGCCADLSVNGAPVSWTETGRQLLGLTTNEAVRLFDADNGINEVRRIAEKIAARVGERL